jgi:tetratricopeptide (TPR) repeat protein
MIERFLWVLVAATAASLELVVTVLALRPAAPQSASSQLFDPAFLARAVCSAAGDLRRSSLRPIAAAAAAPVGGSVGDEPPLWDGLGTVSFPITTAVPKAQRLFDQGLRWAYAFNHGEARRAFRAAQRLDPPCAMCFWGEALVLGPNINAPMVADAVAPALAALTQAQALAGRASEQERALIGALGQRYAADAGADRSALDAAYADAMAAVAGRFPDQPDIAVLAAEAIMDVSPWDYWENDHATPKGRTAALIGLLEGVLARHPDHPGAIHLYIHAVEASTTPERAEPYADRLTGLMPGAGHIEHMPSHIYYRIGRFVDSLRVNRRAIAADRAYLAHGSAGSVYANGYVPHNVHFLMVSAQMAGDRATTLDAIDSLKGALSPEMSAAVPWVQLIDAAPYFAHAQMSEPETALAVADPGDTLPYVKAAWHYMRAVASATAGDIAAARREDGEIAAIAAASDFSDMVAGGVPAPDLLTIARAVIAARIAQAAGDLDVAIAAYRRAVAIEDTLPYLEPPYWYYPVRQSLGSALLMAGDARGAQQVLWQSLMRVPNNGWALFALREAYRAVGDAAAAVETDRLLSRAWIGDLDLLALERL